MAMAFPGLPTGVFDLVFSFDTTGSMSRVIDEVKGRVSDMIQRLQADIPSIRIGVIAHGDYCDKDVFYLEKHIDLSTNIVELTDFITNVDGTGGGDPEECYEYILRVARGLDWAPGSQRALVVIGDSVPHEPEYALNADNLDWRVEATALREMGVKIYGVQAFEEEDSTKFFEELVTLTSGEHLKLGQFSNICDFIMAICYRERGTEFLEGYEAEVRAREARKGLHKDLEGLFGVLRRGDSNASRAGTLSKVSSITSNKTPMPDSPGTLSRFDSDCSDVFKPRRSPLKPLDTMSSLGSSVSVVPDSPGTLSRFDSDCSDVFKPRRSPLKPLDTMSSLGSSVSVVPDITNKPSPKRKATLVKKGNKHAVKKRVAANSKDVRDKKKASKSKVYNTETKYRHNVPNSKFILGGKSLKSRWTHWKLVVAPYNQTNSNFNQGIRRKLFPWSKAGERALYEVAVQKKLRQKLKKFVMYSKMCVIEDWSVWDKKLLGGGFVRRQVKEVMRNCGYIWVRRLSLKGMGKRQQGLVNQYQNGRYYKYALNKKTQLQKPGKLSWAMETN